MWRYYNANPKNNSVTDCFIRSLSVALNLPWDTVYSKISDIAQWEGTTMDNRDFVLEYLDRNFERVPVRETVIETAKKYKKNVVLITMKNHITCAKFGEIIDTFDPSDRFAEYCWIVD